MAQLTALNLSLGYDAHPIVEGLKFTVNAGDYLCIVGENGSGKTTLMRTLLHLQKAVSGQIQYGDGLRANQIGYLPQQSLLQKDFPASVREIVLSGCQARSGLRPFWNKEEKNWRRAPCGVWGSRSFQSPASGSSPEGSSGFSWPGLCARPGRSSFWMNQSPAWIPWSRRNCTDSSRA